MMPRSEKQLLGKTPQLNRAGLVTGTCKPETRIHIQTHPQLLFLSRTLGHS